jgi:hypothetical protein
MLAIYPRYNTSGRVDATGAFQPKAREFLQIHRVPFNADHTVVFDNVIKMDLRRSAMARALRIPRPELKVIAFFCHGWKDGIQCGYRSQDVAAFAELLSGVTGGKLEKLLLYACDNARDGDDDRADDLKEDVGGDGGFADKLRDEFRRRGDAVTVFAHAKEGHTTNNPYVRVFAADESFGGRFLVDPSDKLLWARWRRALMGTDLWARFPFMSRQALVQELAGDDNVG